MDFEQLYKDEVKAHRFTKIELHDLKHKEAHIKHLTERENTQDYIKRLQIEKTALQIKVVGMKSRIEDLLRENYRLLGLNKGRQILTTSSIVPASFGGK